MMSMDFFMRVHGARPPGLLRWGVVAMYTAALPYVILVFQALERHFPAAFTAQLPLLIIALLATVYMAAGVKQKKVLRCSGILAVSALIVLIIMMAEPNGNKHIHIPQYVLMTWLLYWALAADYQGRGLLLLIFICAVMLGFVDELMQGFHPQRSYGGSDMMIDAAAALIGVLMLMGVTESAERQWAWTGRLRDYGGCLVLIVLGAGTALWMGIRLFDVAQQGAFGFLYPAWLLIGNLLFVAAAAAAIIYHWHHGRVAAAPAAGANPVADDGRIGARRWIFSLLAILAVIHALVLGAVVAGLDFR